MRVAAILFLLLPLVVIGAMAEFPQTRLPLTGEVLAVVSPSELDVMVTRSTVSDVLPARSVVRLLCHGPRAPERFDTGYMEAYDLAWILAHEREIYFELATPIADTEARWPAYVYLDPGGFGMLNAFLLASGLVGIDPMLEPSDEKAQLLLDIAAAAERANVGFPEDSSEE